MLEPLRRAPTWRLHTIHYNFQRYLLRDNSSLEYRTSLKAWQFYFYYSSTIFQFLDPIYQMVSVFIFLLA